MVEREATAGASSVLQTTWSYERLGTDEARDC